MSSIKSISKAEQRRSDLSVLITRPEESARRLAEQVMALGLTPIVAPMIAIKALDVASEEVEALVKTSVDFLIFVSKNAARYGVPKFSQQQLSASGLCAVG
ncbi:MAG: uroporphyrinogen-III synthase, partial [Pseudomonadota bacterium]